MSNEDAYTMEEMAKMLNIKVETLRNRISAGKNHPPFVRGLERPFPKDEYYKWCKNRIERENKAS